MMTTEAKIWRAERWDSPRCSGARYAVALGDYRFVDERGRVVTYASREEAMAQASALNEAQLEELQSPKFQALDPDGKRAVSAIMDAMVQSLNDYAGMMERGEMPMRSGPDALREFGATLNVALLSQEKGR